MNMSMSESMHDIGISVIPLTVILSLASWALSGISVYLIYKLVA